MRETANPCQNLDGDTYYEDLGKSFHTSRMATVQILEKMYLTNRTGTGESAGPITALLSMDIDGRTAKRSQHDH